MRTKSLIEIWIAGLSELVIYPHARQAFFGYIMRKNEKRIDEGYEAIGKGKDMLKDVAVYTALIRVLERVRKLGLGEEKIVVKSDSKRVVRQMTVQRRVTTTERLKPLFYKAEILSEGMDIEFQWIPKGENKEAHIHIRDVRESKKYFQF